MTGTAGLAHDITGSGEPLVLVHGLSSSRRAWDLVTSPLAERFTVHAVDLPGHGESPLPGPVDELTPDDLADAVETYLDAQGIATAHVVGNSLGGWTVLELAARGRARSVTALAPAGLWQGERTATHVAHLNRAMSRATRPVAPFLLRAKAIRAATFRTAVERGRDLPYGIALDAAIAYGAAPGFRAALAGAQHRRFERAADVKADVPVTVVFGDRDRFLPAPHCQVRDLAPAHTRWEVLWRCGHAPMWDVPRLTVDLVRETADAAPST